MGQQQLLLLVLGIVVVGLAVVVGIQAFGENSDKSNSDALTSDLVRMASEAQAYYRKPATYGGGEGSFAGLLSTGQLGYSTNDDENGACPENYSGNINGCFGIVNSQPQLIMIEGVSLPTSGDDNMVRVTITGPDADDISTETGSHTWP